MRVDDAANRERAIARYQIYEQMHKIGDWHVDGLQSPDLYSSHGNLQIYL